MHVEFMMASLVPCGLMAESNEHHSCVRPPAGEDKHEKVLTTADLEAGLKRVRELIRIGDIAGARLILERGTASDHAATLFALAQTYDPLELERWRVIGPKADPNRAKHLYERANLGGRNPVFPRIA